MMKKHFHWKNLQDRLRIIDSVRQDAINIGTTDTVLGLFGQTSKKVFDKLNTIKERKDKPYIILIKSAEQAQLYSQSFQSEIFNRFIHECWPGPVTLIGEAHDQLPDFLKTNGTIALRVPAHDGLLFVLGYVDGLFSTSANKSGYVPPATLQDIDKSLLSHIDHIVVDDSNTIKSIPSTILDCTSKTIKVIREGAYPIGELEKIYGRPFEK